MSASEKRANLASQIEKFIFSINVNEASAIVLGLSINEAVLLSYIANDTGWADHYEKDGIYRKLYAKKIAQELPRYFSSAKTVQNIIIGLVRDGLLMRVTINNNTPYYRVPFKIWNMLKYADELIIQEAKIILLSEGKAVKNDEGGFPKLGGGVPKIGKQ